MTATVRFDYTPQDKQKLLHGTKARQILFGGAAGGGKSHAIRWDAIIFCLQNPGLQAYLFRRTLGELEDNHIREVMREIPQNVGTYNGSSRAMNFVNGSILRFCYCEKENDVLRYQGAEIGWLGIDEATHLSPSQITFLRTRNRLGSYSTSPDFKDTDYLPRFVMASNPGGPSHSFLKQVFMDGQDYTGRMKLPMQIFHDETTKDASNSKDHGWASIYIPARMVDNKYLDVGYAGVFSGLPQERAKALRDGDWDAVVGAALDMLSKTRHMVKRFMPPRHWLRFMSMDWGTAAPFSIGWYAVIGEDTEVLNNSHLISHHNPDGRIFLPQGSVVRYAEFYGWNGKPNQGCRLDARAVARKIVEIEEFRGDVPDYRIADSQMWAQSDGPSAQENMVDASDGLITLRPSQKDRRANYAEIICRLAGNPLLFSDGTQADHPMFFCTDNCQHFWRTLPTLTIDEIDADKGPDVSQEDHIYDEVAYGLRSRPYVMTEADRFEADYGREFRNLKKKGDAYSTA